MIAYQHGGDIYTNQVTQDFSVNINPLGLPDRVKEAVTEALNGPACYPDSRNTRLRQALAKHHHVGMESIICGNGAADLIYQLVFAKKPKRAMVLSPSFSEYEQALNSVGCRVFHCSLSKKSGFRLSAADFIGEMDPALDMVFLCNPNNPTGHAVKKEEMKDLLSVCREWDILAVVDECFCDFLEQAQEYSVLEYLDEFPQLLVLKAFTKTYAMASVRLGYGLCSQSTLLDEMRMVRQPWSVSLIAQKAGIAALGEKEYLKQAISLIARERKYLKEALWELGFFVYPSQVNYLLFEDLREVKDGQCLLYEQCKARQVLIRSCANYRGLDYKFYRICVKSREENERLISVLKEILSLGYV